MLHATDVFPPGHSPGGCDRYASTSALVISASDAAVSPRLTSQMPSTTSAPPIAVAQPTRSPSTSIARSVPASGWMKSVGAAAVASTYCSAANQPTFASVVAASPR